MVLKDEPLRVGWCHPVDGLAPASIPQIDLVPCTPDTLRDLRGTSLLVLDASAFDSLEALFDARSALGLPTLLLVFPHQIDGALARLSPRDEIGVQGAPVTLLSHRLWQLWERALTTRDSLTGLVDRQAFLEHLKVALERAAHDNPVSVLMVDIDRFKQINDRHGHAVGDAVLHTLARRILTRTSPRALVARFGGEEMGLVMFAGEADAIAEAELIAEITRREEIGEGIHITVSVGVATANGQARRRDILSKVEEAVFAAKVRGRDCVIHHAEIERRALESDESVALEGFENLTKVISERIAEVITHRGRRLFEALKREAEIDVLTQLHNRRYLDRRLSYVFGASRSTAQPLTVALLDIDHFGEVNKTHGWPTGDKVLKELSALIVQNVRGNDWVARYGGEELCLVMSGTPIEDAAQVLERLRAGIAAHNFETTEGSSMSMTVSMGATQRHKDDESVRDMLERVSDRLLEAKRGGRDRVWTDLSETVKPE